MKKYILMTLAGMMLTSCVDTIILPDHLTVDEDFWKTKEDVSSMVNAAYAAMASEDVVTRLIIWGDFRSDELVPSSTVTGTVADALAEIAAVNMQPTISFATWSGFYNVINRCNIVLEKASAVQNEDPNYTQGDYLAHRSQMLALRSMCYFYLVRAFRDVPYIKEAYMNSSQNTSVAQSSPEYVLSQCIVDLEEALPNATKASGSSTRDWRRVGWLTDDGIKTLLADIYLWRASVKHSAADYQRCADLCKEVILSKNNQVENVYDLARSTNYYRDLFVNQNATESIFELQMTNNAAVCKYFFTYDQKKNNEGFLRASSIFGSQSTDIKAIGKNAFAEKDIRFFTSTFLPSTGTLASYGVRKMVANTSLNTLTKQSSTTREDYTSFNQNYIIYRLTDAMLMRAEALVQLSDSTAGDTYKEQAYALVREVNARALLDPAADSVKWNTFKSYDKSAMELLVMQERLREFCFEGKRWYDLLRYNYRHVDVDYNHTFGELMGSNTNYQGVKIYDKMLELMTRSRGADAAGVMAKMRGEPYLYMPIPNADINVCPLLKQNPAYKNSNDYIKTY